MFDFELLMGFDAVSADADDDGFLGFERFDFITEINGFLCSARGVVFGIEVQDNDLANKILECDFLAIV